MSTYKIIFQSGVKETIEAHSIELNEVLEKVEILGEDGEEIEEMYLSLENISGIIPQD